MLKLWIQSDSINSTWTWDSTCKCSLLRSWPYRSALWEAVSHLRKCRTRQHIYFEQLHVSPLSAWPVMPSSYASFNANPKSGGSIEEALFPNRYIRLWNFVQNMWRGVVSICLYQSTQLLGATALLCAAGMMHVIIEVQSWRKSSWNNILPNW